ncbi:MAG: SH3 domain-containing protein [Rhodospirillaceae bacterium]|nr:SH3 domain-containing protein [Rhodospirillaceae bacterium]
MDSHRSACLCALVAALLLCGPGPAAPAPFGAVLFGVGPALASKLKVPRFVSLRFGRVNLRTGPGKNHPIEWVYQRRGLPVEVIRDYDTWRQVRDRWGTVGWIHVSNLTGRRTVLIDPKSALLRRRPQEAAAAVARAEAGAIAQLKKCAAAWCRISAEGHTGWVRRSEVWGLHKKDDGR